jgi:DNA modification methylase
VDEFVNTLYYGDNLDVLRQHVQDETIDLVYLDPPFNSQASYNVLFKEVNGVTESAAQVRAFEDTWHWDVKTEGTLVGIAQSCPPHLVDMMDDLIGFLGRNDMTAYLVMMAIRLVELHRVLKPAGSLYLHCDPTAGHYLKILLDEIFGKDRMLNEIIWKRTSAHSDARQGAKHYGRLHDMIFVYTKGRDYTFSTQYTDYDQEYIEKEYKYVEPETGRRYKASDLTAAKPGGDTSYEWKGVRPYKGRYWAYSKENMEQFEAQNRLHYTETGTPRLKQYLDEMPGVALQDLWTDIPPTSGNERLGYPTQKPLALLERIIRTSSNPGDIVLDPFCGCGTAVVAAEKLGRRWLGIDITHLAVNLIRNRLNDMFPGTQFRVVGEPVDLSGARALAAQDRFQFEWWALSLVRARPAGGQAKKGADTGIDGVLYFMEARGKSRKVVVQVKSGKVGVKDINEFAHVIEREKAALGLFLTLEPPTGPMKTEAAGMKFYDSELWGEGFPRLQILTIEDLLQGQRPRIPAGHITYKRAGVAEAQAETLPLFGTQDE